MRFPASIDNSIGVLTGWRFTKSGIESVILAGSSIFALSEAKSWILTLEQCPWRAQRAIFSMILIFWLQKLKNFARPQGQLSKGCQLWLETRATVGNKLVSGGLGQQLEQLVELFRRALTPPRSRGGPKVQAAAGRSGRPVRCRRILCAHARSLSPRTRASLIMLTTMVTSPSSRTCDTQPPGKAVASKCDSVGEAQSIAAIKDATAVNEQESILKFMERRPSEAGPSGSSPTTEGDNKPRKKMKRTQDTPPGVTPSQRDGAPGKLSDSRF